MTTSSEAAIVYESNFLRVAKRGTWEYVTRTKANGVVVIVALYDDARVALVEQHRPPVNANVIELPAGLAGDTDDEETFLQAAKRELKEETGYTAGQWTRLVTGLSSAGLTDATVIFFRATGLNKVSEGGGVGFESTKVHEIALADLPVWLASTEASGTKIDIKLLPGIYAATESQGKGTP